MLENPPESPGLSAPPNSKRYVPPNQRNRRKSADHHRSEGTRSVSDAESSRSSFPPQLLIALNGCYRSEAFRLLRHRWESAINSCHDPSMASSERPVLYRGSIELPHQLLSGPQTQNQMDFLAELRRAIDEKRSEERE